jgi:hypothetical protein
LLGSWMAALLFEKWFDKLWPISSCLLAVGTRKKKLSKKKFSEIFRDFPMMS